MIHECSTFPNAPNDDWVDMISQALKRWQDQVYGLLDLMKEYTVDAKMRGVRIASVSLAEGKTPTPKEEDVNKVATSAVIKPATAPNTQCSPEVPGRSNHFGWWFVDALQQLLP